MTLLAAGQKAPVLGLLGGLMLALVAMYLPFAQVQLAAQNRFDAVFRVRLMRDHFRHAPWAFLLALIGTLSFALPLYLLKIEILPREAAWLPSIAIRCLRVSGPAADRLGLCPRRTTPAGAPLRAAALVLPPFGPAGDAAASPRCTC